MAPKAKNRGVNESTLGGPSPACLKVYSGFYDVYFSVGQMVIPGKDG